MEEKNILTIFNSAHVHKDNEADIYFGIVMTFLGQTLSNIGIWLRSPVFAHGQLYVAVSRVGDPKNLKFAMMKNKDGSVAAAENVVYKEVLLN